MSPIQITTGLKPKTTFDHLLFKGNKGKLASILPLRSSTIQRHVEEFIEGLEQTWGDVAKARAEKAEKNSTMHRRKPKTLPEICIGDYVLVANPVRMSKLMFKWTGPWIVTDTISPFVYECKPASSRKMRARNVHVSRIRRFAGKSLNMTEQIQKAVDRDFPPNEVQEIVGHRKNKADGELHLQVQWLGFTKAERTWESAAILHQDVPEYV